MSPGTPADPLLLDVVAGLPETRGEAVETPATSQLRDMVELLISCAHPRRQALSTSCVRTLACAMVLLEHAAVLDATPEGFSADDMRRAQAIYANALRKTFRLRTPETAPIPLQDCLRALLSQPSPPRHPRELGPTVCAHAFSVPSGRHWVQAFRPRRRADLSIVRIDSRNGVRCGAVLGDADEPGLTLAAGAERAAVEECGWPSVTLGRAGPRIRSSYHMRYASGDRFPVVTTFTFKGSTVIRVDSFPEGIRADVLTLRFAGLCPTALEGDTWHGRTVVNTKVAMRVVETPNELPAKVTAGANACEVSLALSEGGCGPGRAVVAWTAGERASSVAHTHLTGLD